MIFGIAITGTMMLAGGATLLSLIAFQVLSGLRIIKLGKRHRIVHRWTAFAIAAFSVVHASIAVVYVTAARIG